MSRDELASLDVLGSDEQLRAAARQEPPVTGTGAEGRDASRAVAVQVDRRGVVSDVLISAWWRDDLTPSGLQEAILSAYQAALAQATTLIAPYASPRAEVPEAADDDYDGDYYGWLLSVQRRLDRSGEALAQSGERLTQSRAAERVISGPAGLVRLVVTGGVVTEVRIDARDALQESPGRLSADALAAFQTID